MALTKERIVEILLSGDLRTGEASEEGRRAVAEGMSENLLVQIAIEAATAAERERSRELVCDSCGAKPLPRYGKDSDEPYDYWCDDCVFQCDPVTRAEYERRLEAKPPGGGA